MKNFSLLSGVLVMGFGLVGCGEESVSDQPGTTPEIVMEEPAETNGSAGMFSDFDKNDYRVTVKMENMGTEAGPEMGDMTIEFDADTKYTKMTGTVMGQSMEIIDTGAEVYSNMLGGTWTKIPGGSEKENDDLMTREQMEEWIQLPHVEALGEEACGDKKCEVYQETVDGVTNKVYIDTKENRPQMVVASQEGGGTTTITYDYDVEVEIELPEVSGEMAIPTMGDMDPAAMEEMMNNLEAQTQE